MRLKIYSFLYEWVLVYLANYVATLSVLHKLFTFIFIELQVWSFIGKCKILSFITFFYIILILFFYDLFWSKVIKTFEKYLRKKLKIHTISASMRTYMRKIIENNRRTPLNAWSYYLHTHTHTYSYCVCVLLPSEKFSKRKMETSRKELQ